MPANSVFRDFSTIPSARLQGAPRDRVLFVEIGEDSAGQRLDNFLIRVAKGVPKGHIYRIIRKGEVRVNRARASVETKLAAGDVVRVPPMRIAERENQTGRAAPLPAGKLDVLFEDRHLLVVNKPKGMVVHPAPGPRVSSDTSLLARFSALHPGAALPRPAHYYAFFPRHATPFCCDSYTSR